MDCVVDAPRDFTPERTGQANVYEAVAAQIAELRKARKRVVLASYSKGSRDRLQGLLADHGLKRIVLADNWQEELGASQQGSAALAVLPLDHGLTTPDTGVLPEQDMIGPRLFRRHRRQPDADLDRESAM